MAPMGGGTSIAASPSPFLLIAAIPRAVTEVSRLAKRPRSGLALIRRTRLRQSCGEEDGSSSLEGVWRTGVRAVELETLMLVSSHGYPLLTMVNGPLMAWRSWPDSYRSRPVRAAATTSAPWCCSPFRALPGASFRLATIRMDSPAPPPNPTAAEPRDGRVLSSLKAVFACT
jgi:hypothetical protein